MACPLSKKDAFPEILPEIFATTVYFALSQAVLAKIAGLPIRVPTLLGAAIPLSYYAISILEHRTYPDNIVHNPKHRLARSAVITFLTLIIIRSYKQTSHQIPFAWIPIPLLTGYIAPNLN